MAVLDIDKLSEDISKLKINGIKKSIERLALAYQVNQELAPINELGKLLEAFIDKVISVLRVGMGSVMLVDKMQKELRIQAARGLKEEIVKQARVKFGEGISGWVAKEGKPLLVEDLSKDDRFRKRNHRYHNDSLLTVPLMAGKELIGVLNVNNKNNKEVFNENDMKTLVTIASQAAVFIKNSQEYEKIKKLSEVKSDFISTVSHELRTPLAAIKESLALLLDKIPGGINKKQEDVLNLAKRNIDRLNRLVTNLLDSSKMEAGKVEMRRDFINITQVLKDIVKSFKAQAAKKSLTFMIHSRAKIRGIWADSDKIHQVLNNLITNAIKYTNDGGRIDIILRKKYRHVEIIVKDTGAGIRKEDIGKVFDKYSQISFEGEGATGTGLGLAITKDIVSLHKGNISVESEIGKGSTFTVALPMDLRRGRKKKKKR